MCSSYLPLGVSNELFLQAINEFSGAVVGKEEDFCKESLSRTIFYFVFVLLYFIFACIVLSKIQKNEFLYSCFYLLPCSFARMGTPENTKLCDFTSTKNNNFICTPIAPPAPETNFYKIKPALLNLVMKEQFFGVSSDNAAAHLNNFVELYEMQKYKNVDGNNIKLKLYSYLNPTNSDY
jgi:hypothetical protein